MSTIKLSDIYRESFAHLLTEEDGPNHEGTVYSCCAISRAACALLIPEIPPENYPFEFGEDSPARRYYPLENVPYSNGFNEFPPGIERQSARFLWLCMLATIAESEGL